MTAEEFAQWQVMYRQESWLSRAQEYRHAQLLAAIHNNGAVPRKPRAAWDFMAPDPWGVPEPKRPASTATIRAQIAALNARQRQARKRGKA